MREYFQKSYFTKLSPRNKIFKDGPIKLARGPNGGFRNPGKYNDRLDLGELLKKYEHIKSERDRYTEEERKTHEPIISYKENEEKLGEATRLAINRSLN